MTPATYSRGWYCLASIGEKAIGPVKACFPSVGNTLALRLMMQYDLLPHLQIVDKITRSFLRLLCSWALSQKQNKRGEREREREREREKKFWHTTDHQSWWWSLLPWHEYLHPLREQNKGHQTESQADKSGLNYSNSPCKDENWVPGGGMLHTGPPFTGIWRHAAHS
ncbi:rCG65857 [Rattus norvegicus]|uniref:LRRGT00051 n=2 Tax=Rattus norvegicus TaxID=10116 RepID=F7EYW9_RAT|nr:LRRGT00051 [Rattus norvegicus]EDL81677.1 rCG65857 [Rattus norvegicus]|eukprot:NP_001041425.1 uncharacterized protein LOC500702 [Rattus norvegicus]